MSARARRPARPASDVATLRRIERLIVAAWSQAISIGCDTEQDIVGKWAVEIGEMTSFSKADYNKLKQTLSAELIRRRLTQAGG